MISIEGLQGFKQIISNTYLNDIINRYTIDDAARSRIRGLNKSNYISFYHIKASPEIIYKPAFFLGREICDSNDTAVKWFLLLYSIASVNDIYRDKIYSFVDSRIKSNWREPQYSTPGRLDNRPLDNILDGILDIDAYFGGGNGNFGPEMCEWKYYKQAIILVCLSAGYHWERCREYMPTDLLSRNIGMPITLSIAFYISVLTGVDFYDALRAFLESNGKKNSLDDILTMAKAEKAKLELLSLKDELEKKLSICEEKIRREQNALDITMDAYGKGHSKEELERRIAKCNSEASIDVLSKAKQIIGEQVSFPFKLSDYDKKHLLIADISAEYNIVISECEEQAINTVEQLVDTVISHRYFLDSLRTVILTGGISCGTIHDASYNINTKIAEVKKLFGEHLNLGNVTTDEELKDALLRELPHINLRNYLAEKLGVDPSEITSTANLYNDLGADSLEIVEIAIDIENMLDIEIPDLEWAEAYTVEDASQLIWRKLTDKYK